MDGTDIRERIQEALDMETGDVLLIYGQVQLVVLIHTNNVILHIDKN